MLMLPFLMAHFYFSTFFMEIQSLGDSFASRFVVYFVFVQLLPFFMFGFIAFGFLRLIFLKLKLDNKDARGKEFDMAQKGS